MRRSDSEKLWNLPKLPHESRLLQYWLARRFARTAPTVSQKGHSCLLSSMRPLSKTLLWELATEEQWHQLHRWSSPVQTDAHNHVTHKDPLWFSPSDAPAHPHLMVFRGNPARAIHVFLDASADHGQSDDCLGIAGILHDAHVWARRHFSGIPGNKNGWAYWQHLIVLSGGTCQAQLPHTPFSCGKFSSTESSGALCWCLSHLRWSLTSLPSVEFAMALASACPGLHSVLST